jgi:DNA/RNA-binding domain of Phe-tRNA-synthetase-like protein
MMAPMTLLTLSPDLDLPDLVVGVTWATGVGCGPSPAALADELQAAVTVVESAEVYPAPDLKKAVRDVLRTRGYKPAGRGKPASEYLAGVARKGEFPSINALVDVNNLVSLESGLPISVLDRGRFSSTPSLRHGLDGERYVFNHAGQEIDLRGLLVVCDGDEPRGMPVKDSMATKVDETTHEVLAVIYGTTKVVDRDAMAALTERFARLLTEHAGATETTTDVLQDR